MYDPTQICTYFTPRYKQKMLYIVVQTTVFFTKNFVNNFKTSFHKFEFIIIIMPNNHTTYLSETREFPVLCSWRLWVRFPLGINICMTNLNVCPLSTGQEFSSSIWNQVHWCEVSKIFRYE